MGLVLLQNPFVTRGERDIFVNGGSCLSGYGREVKVGQIECHGW